MARGKIKKWLKKTKENVKSGVKDLGKTVGGAIKKGGQAVGNAYKYTALLPFKPVMVSALKKKGEDVKLSTKMDKLVPLFRDVIIKKNTRRNYENLYLENLADDEIAILVQEVLGFLKELVKKKENNEPLTSEEKEIYDDTKEAGDELKREANKTGGDGENWLKQYGVIILAVAAVVLFLAFRKK